MNRGNLCFTIFFLTILFSFKAAAQSQFKVTGSIIDSLRKPIVGVSIRLIEAFFLKNNQLSLSLQANDLFNQGVSFMSMVNDNYISENRTKFISRFIQVGVTYNLSHFGSNREPPENSSDDGL